MNNKIPWERIIKELKQEISLDEQADLDRFAPLRGLDDLHGDALTVSQRTHAGRLQDRDVDENVLATILAGHKAETLFGVEPLDGAVKRRRLGGVD